MGNWPSISLVLRTICPCLENGLVAQQRHRDRLDPVGRDDPAELAQRLGRDVRLELAADRALQLGALDREPVGVGRDHRHLRAAGADQDAGQHRAHVVARGGPRDEIHGRGKRRGRDRQRLALLLGEGGEVLAGQDAEVEARAAAANLDVALRLAQLDLNRRVAERARELGQKAAGEEDRAGALDLGLELGLQAHLEIGCAEADPVLVGGEQDSGERLGRGAGRYSSGDDRELGDELVTFGCQLQVMIAFLSWIRACGKAGKRRRLGFSWRLAGCGLVCGKALILTAPSAVRPSLWTRCG